MPISEAPRNVELGSPRPSGMRVTVPSKLETPTAPAPASMSLGEDSSAIGIVAATESEGASTRVTVAVFAFSTHTALPVTATAIGAGVSEPGRATSRGSSVTSPLPDRSARPSHPVG